MFGTEKAKARTIIAFKYSDEPAKLFIGETHGKIVSPRGIEWFAWDSIFVPEGQDLSYAEMTLEEKMKISHRTKALEKFIEFLKEN